MVDVDQQLEHQDDKEQRDQDASVLFRLAGCRFASVFFGLLDSRQLNAQLDRLFGRGLHLLLLT
jgi:hypothetical protein